MKKERENENDKQEGYPISSRLGLGGIDRFLRIFNGMKRVQNFKRRFSILFQETVAVVLEEVGGGELELAREADLFHQPSEIFRPIFDRIPIILFRFVKKPRKKFEVFVTGTQDLEGRALEQSKKARSIVFDKIAR